MAAGGTYSGTVTVPVQKGTSYGVSFDGIYVPAVLTTPEDGFQSERDYQHKSEVRDIAGNIVNKTFGGSFIRSRGTLTIPLGSAGATRDAIIALYPGDTLSMQAVKTDGTLDVAENWMIEEDVEIDFNRENNTVTLSVIKEPGITPA
jgi:hypothetical protein